MASHQALLVAWVCLLAQLLPAAQASPQPKLSTARRYFRHKDPNLFQCLGLSKQLVQCLWGQLYQTRRVTPQGKIGNVKENSTNTDFLPKTALPLL